MKVFKFPDVNNEKWDGKGLKKKHLKSLGEQTIREEKINAARRLLEQLKANIDKAETKVFVLKQELKKAKQQYHAILQNEDSE